jgi:hypothetical protein
VHGRNKDEKAQRVGAVDWAMVKRIRQVVGVPMIANGGISSPQDIEDCLLATGCDAAMSSEMSLAHPGVFRPVGQPRPSVDSVVARYLELVEKYKASVHSVHKPLRAHLFKLLYPALQMNPCIRDRLASTSDIPEMKKCTEELALTNWEQALQAQDDDEDGWFKASWYCRHRNHQSEEAEGAEVSNGSGRDPSAILQIQLKGIIEELAQGRDEWNKVQNEEIAMNRKQKASVKRRISKAEKLKAKYERKLNDLKKNKAEDDPGAEESVAKKAKTEGAAEETTADLESNK